jgi:hypothetical protein
MSETGKRKLETIAAPFGRVVQLEEVDLVSGIRLLQATIRDGQRSTVVDLDAPAAAQWGAAMRAWADAELARLDSPVGAADETAPWPARRDA